MTDSNKELESLIAKSFEAYKLHLLENGADLKQLKNTLKQLKMSFEDFCLLCLIHHSYFCSIDFTAKSWDKSKTFIVKQLNRFYETIYPKLSNNELMKRLDEKRLQICSKSGRCDSDFGLSSVSAIAMMSGIKHSDLIGLAQLSKLDKQGLSNLLLVGYEGNTENLPQGN